MDAKKTGAFIASIRKENGKTQKDLAKELNVSNAAISRWERGIGFPDITLIEPLAECLHISVAELLNGKRSKQTENERALSDVISLSSATRMRKKKFINWILAAAVAVVYLVVSIITQKWELTWVFWGIYCAYRVITEYFPKNLQFPSKDYNLSRKTPFQKTDESHDKN